MNRIVLAVIVAVFLVGGAFLITKSGSLKSSEGENIPFLSNVTIVNGIQIVDVTAKGGYEPRRSAAKAGMPTILRFNTKGTFDCSSSVRIPSMNISKSLPISGVTDIDLGSPTLGVLKGSCGMGMYPFEIDFQS